MLNAHTGLDIRHSWPLKHIINDTFDSARSNTHQLHRRSFHFTMFNERDLWIRVMQTKRQGFIIETVAKVAPPRGQQKRCCAVWQLGFLQKKIWLLCEICRDHFSSMNCNLRPPMRNVLANVKTKKNVYFFFFYKKQLQSDAERLQRPNEVHVVMFQNSSRSTSHTLYYDTLLRPCRCTKHLHLYQIYHKETWWPSCCGRWHKSWCHFPWPSLMDLEFADGSGQWTMRGKAPMAPFTLVLPLWHDCMSYIYLHILLTKYVYFTHIYL